MEEIKTEGKGRPFINTEQKKFKDDDIKALKALGLEFLEDPSKIRYLGLNRDYYVSYYIGIDWINEEKGNYIAVEPKLKDLDYVKMFVHCLHHPEISKFFKKVYHIDSNSKRIQITAPKWDLTPFLIVHFLSVVDIIVKRGLKSNYIVRDENLTGKVKGKILVSQQIKKNIVAQREDRVYCRFQEYSVDCFENRLLKKTLLFIQRYSPCYREKYKELIQKQNRLLRAFENISDEISYSEIKQIKVNCLYKEYKEAIDLAKKILNRFGYSYKNVEKEEEKELPPFWINMSRLFELYVYSLLKEAFPEKKQISYQEIGERSRIDFLKFDAKLIIDAKYKKGDADREPNLEDIGQLCRYARDRKVLEKLKISSDNEVVDCVIIYPDEEESTKSDFQGRELKEKEIKGFTKFYKCGIKLPIKDKDNKNFNDMNFLI